MKTILFDSKGNKSGQIDIPKKISDSKITPSVIAQVVRVHLINDRQGTLNVKTRSEVRGKAKKPYKQKGTGNARQGSKKGPQWRGGGVAHAPKMTFYKAKIQSKVNTSAISMALKKKANNNTFFIFEQIELSTNGLSKQISQFIKNTNLDGNILMAVKNMDPKLKRAVKNIENLTLKSYKSLDVYSILEPKYILVERSAL